MTSTRRACSTCFMLRLLGRGLMRMDWYRRARRPMLWHRHRRGALR
ncbi:hypothetical protein ACFPRL_31045 [Pseudoclavibacter helvolus]